MEGIYYHITWPESQGWLSQKDPIEDGLVIPGPDNDCFVEKNLYEYVQEDKNEDTECQSTK